MNRKYMALLIAIFFIALFFYLDFLYSITGLVSQTLRVGIDPIVVGSISVLKYEPFTVEPNHTITIDVEFLNTGSLPFDAHIFLEIQYYNTTTHTSFTDAPVTLDPGERRHFQVMHTAIHEGFNRIKADVTYDMHRHKRAYGMFFVGEIEEEEEEEEEEGWSGPTGGDEEEPGEETGQYYANFTFEYQNTMILTQGQSTLIPIFITAQGNESSNDIKFFITQSELPFNVTPYEIPILTPGSRGIFLLDIEVPVDIELGTYDVFFKIVSRESTQFGRIVIDVRQIPLIDQLNDTIQNYKYLVNRLKREIELLRQEGKNTSFAELYISYAERDLGLAEVLLSENINNSRFDDVIFLLDKVREEIIQAVLEINRIQIPAMPIEVPLYFYIIIIIVVITVLVIEYRKRKEKKQKNNPVIKAISNLR